MRCAFLTTDDLSGYVADDHLAIPPLRARGVEVTPVPWRARLDWSAFDLVVVRTTWDYHRHPDDFLAALASIDAATRLENPLELIRWNLRKTYLRDLEARGIRVVPTAWLDALGPGALEAAAERLGAPDLIVKPVVGASAEHTYRVTPSELTGASRTELERRFRSRPVMLQPFLSSVMSGGEWAAMLIDGALSHVVRKRPASGDFRVQEEHGGSVERVDPGPDLVGAVRAATGWIVPPPLYARVDFLRSADGALLLSELELIEPALYLRTDPDAPDRLADAIVRRLDPTTTTR